MYLNITHLESNDNLSYTLDQHHLIELSATLEMFLICAVKTITTRHMHFVYVKRSY